MPLATTCLYGDKEIGVDRALEIKAEAESAGQTLPRFLCTFCGKLVGPWGGESPHIEHVDRNPTCLLSHVPRGAAKRSGHSKEWESAFRKMQKKLKVSASGKYLTLYPQPRNEMLFYRPDDSAHPLHIIEPNSLVRVDVFDALSNVIELLPVKVDGRGFYRYAVRDWATFVDVICSSAETDDADAMASLNTRSLKQGALLGQGDAIRRMVNVAFLTARASGKPIFAVTKDKKLGFPSLDSFHNHVLQLVEKQDRRCALTRIPLSFDLAAKDKSLLCSLDRIDSNGHYVESNLQVVCRFVNRWKGSQPDHEFRRLLALLHEAP